jgi:hypothetical protein
VTLAPGVSSLALLAAASASAFSHVACTLLGPWLVYSSDLEKQMDQYRPVPAVCARWHLSLAGCVV